MFKVYKNNDIEINFEIDRKINLYSYCVDCGFKSLKPLINMTLVIYEKKKLYLKNFCHTVSSVKTIIKESKNRNVAKTNKGRIELLSKCAVCDNKK